MIVMLSPICATVPRWPVNFAWTFFIGSTQAGSAAASGAAGKSQASATKTARIEGPFISHPPYAAGGRCAQPVKYRYTAAMIDRMMIVWITSHLVHVRPSPLVVA